MIILYFPFFPPLFFHGIKTLQRNQKRPIFPCRKKIYFSMQFISQFNETILYLFILCNVVCHILFLIFIIQLPFFCSSTSLPPKILGTTPMHVFIEKITISIFANNILDLFTEVNQKMAFVWVWNVCFCQFWNYWFWNLVLETIKYILSGFQNLWCWLLNQKVMNEKQEQNLKLWVWRLKPSAVKLGNKELFGHHTIVFYCQVVYYLLSELTYWSREIVHYCQVVPYLAIPSTQDWLYKIKE